MNKVSGMSENGMFPNDKHQLHLRFMLLFLTKPFLWSTLNVTLGILEEYFHHSKEQMDHIFTSTKRCLEVVFVDS